MVCAMLRTYGKQLVKLTGVLLFLFIIQRIDKSALVRTLQHADGILVVAAFICIGGIYITRAWRWHMLTQATGLHPTFSESWRLYCIGLFLGNITPGKMGEFGRAVYLQKKGLPLKKGILLGIVDRGTDSIIILLLGIAGAYVLHIQLPLYWMLGGIVAACSIGMMLRQKIHHAMRMALELHSQMPRLFPTAMLATVLGWICYFAWAVLLANSIGIYLPILTLVSIFTFTGVVSMLPIAPSGLGTRDATLIFLLAPYGIASADAIALALLMFLSMITWNATGVWYWVFHKKEYA